MANNCYNFLRVRGTETEISAFLEKHFPENEAEEREFDFNTVIPYPKEFADQDEAYHKHNEAHPNDWSVKSGFSNGGYDWCIKNWSTKWNAYDQMLSYDDTEINAEFYTAWSPPTNLYKALCAMYPNLEIHMEFEENGMGFEGVYDNNNGILAETFFNGNSKRALRGG